MNQPDNATKRAILENTLKSLENEAYSLEVSGKAFRSIGLTERAEAFAKQLTDNMKLHAFYTTELAGIPE